MTTREIQTIEKTEKGHKLFFKDSKNPDGWGPFFGRDLDDARPGMSLEFEWTKKSGQYGDYFLFKGTPNIAPEKSGNAGLSNAEDIFVTGVTGRAMQSGKFEATDIKRLALAAQEAYRAVHGQAEPQTDDEIPW